jgi:tetratricopeptide (TPR) repeat protein
MIVRVCDAESGTPIGEARVSLKIASEPLNDRGAWSHHEGSSIRRTDERGVLEIDGLHAHRYLVDVEAPGFVRHVTATRLLDDRLLVERTRCDEVSWHTLTMGHWNPVWEENLGDLPAVQNLLPVVPPAGEVRVEIRLPRALLLQGSVRDRLGRPLPESRVSVAGHEIFLPVGSGWKSFGLDDNSPVFTNGIGFFVLSVHPKGRLTVRADSPGYVYDHKEIQLEGGTPPLLEFVLDACSSLHGRVLGPGGDPMPQATVAAFVPELGGRIFHTKTDRDGQFRLDDIEPKRLVVVAWEFFRGACWTEQEPTEAPLDLRLQTPRSLQGRVLDIDGRPLKKGSVHQNVLLRVRNRLICIGWKEGMGSEGRVRSWLPGMLSVGVPIQEPSSLVDDHGRFSLDTILDDDGRVHVGVFRSGERGHHQSMETTVPLGLYEQIVFHPGEELRGMYEESLQRELATAEDYARRAEFRLVRHDNDGAREDYDAALRMKPGDPDLLERRALCHRTLKRHDEAIADYTGALQARPQGPMLLYYRGYTYYLAGKYAEAAADLSEAIRIEPANAGHYALRSSIRLTAGDVEEALRDADEAIRLQPDEANNYLGRCHARETRGDLDGALSDCNAALRLRPGYMSAFAARAKVRRTRGDLRGALGDYEAALAEMSEEFFADWREQLQKDIAELRRELGI